MNVYITVKGSCHQAERSTVRQDGFTGIGWFLAVVMGDFAFKCSGLIQLIKIMSLPRRSHTYCQERLATEQKQNHWYFTGSSLLQMHRGCQGMFFPKYMYSNETIIIIKK